MSAHGARRVLGSCAVMGPLMFTAAWLVAWPLQEQYSPRREDISALAALDAQHAWIMILGFIALGVGTTALGLGLMDALRGWNGRVGSALVMAAGVGLVIAGLARNDCSSELSGCAAAVEAGDVSAHHQIHDLVSLLLFLSLIVAQFVCARAFRQDLAMARLADLLARERRADASAAGSVHLRTDRRLERNRPADLPRRAVDLDRGARAATPACSDAHVSTRHDRTADRVTGSWPVNERSTYDDRRRLRDVPRRVSLAASDGPHGHSLRQQP